MSSVRPMNVSGFGSRKLPRPDFSVMDRDPSPAAGLTRDYVAEKMSPLKTEGTPGLLHSNRTPKKRSVRDLFGAEKRDEKILRLTQQALLIAISAKEEEIPINHPSDLLFNLNLTKDPQKILEYLKTLDDKIFENRKSNKTIPSPWYNPKVLFLLQHFLLNQKKTNPDLYDQLFKHCQKIANLIITNMRSDQQSEFLHQIFHNGSIVRDEFLVFALNKFFMQINEAPIFPNYFEILTNAYERITQLRDEIATENPDYALYDETREYIKYLIQNFTTESDEFLSPIRYYHTTDLTHIFPLLKAGHIEPRHEKKYPGAFFSDSPEWSFGDVAITLNPEELAIKGSKITHMERRPIEDNDALWMGFDRPIKITVQRIILGPQLTKQAKLDPDFLVSIRGKLTELGMPTCQLVRYDIEELFRNICIEVAPRVIPRQDALPQDFEILRSPVSIKS